MDVITADYRLLWPDPVGADTASHHFAVAGGGGGAEVLLPLDNRRVMASPFIRPTGAQGWPERSARRLAWLACRAGLGRLLFRNTIHVNSVDGKEGPSLHNYLGEIVGDRHVALSVALGPPRPNRKPVIRIMGEDGRTVGFAKVGWNDLTAGLVRTEAEFLRKAGDGMAGVAVPELLHLGNWRNMTVAVFSPLLGTDRRPRLTPAVLRSIAEADATSSSLAHYIEELERQGLTCPEPHRTSAGLVLARWRERWTGIDLAVGRWHGDLTPWNMGSHRDGRVILWDWERTRSGIPVGFDALHYVAQPLLTARRFEAEPTLTRIQAGAERLLGGLGIADRCGPPLLTLYLLDNLVRHASAHDREGSARLTRRLREVADLSLAHGATSGGRR